MNKNINLDVFESGQKRTHTQRYTLKWFSASRMVKGFDNFTVVIDTEGNSNLFISMQYLRYPR